MATLTPGTVLGQIDEKVTWPRDPNELPLATWDTGVFINELAKLEILPDKLGDFTEHDRQSLQQNPEKLLGKAQDQAPPPIVEGTYRGTQLALTKIYELIEKRYTSYMDTVNFEPVVPSPLTMEQKRKFFAFTDGSDHYPPHLNLAGNLPAAEAEKSKVQKADLKPADIFDKMRLAQLSSLLPTLIPKDFISRGVVAAGRGLATLQFGSMGTPDAGDKLEDVEKYNRDMRGRYGLLKRNDIFDLPNVGDLQDWYSDARFAQQHFTGTNPTTIELASERWITHFVQGSKDPADKKAQETIMALGYGFKESLYVQDYSYFRKAAGMDESAIIQCEFDEPYRENNQAKTRKSHRYGCASVCLFYLTDAGKLLPLAIVVDWRGSAEKSVTIYNRELFKREARNLPTFDPASAKGDLKPSFDEAHDWAWRYAKTCVQCSDWVRHEISIHLTNTHLIEESVIVSANRQLPPNHLVFRLLYPHWQKTLSLNAAARDTLVPNVIVKLIGFTDQQAFKIVQHAYESFDFQGQYVPRDLQRRGFPTAKSGDVKFHNYAYARCIHSMWQKIRSYVAEMLSQKYNGPNADAQVKGDADLQNWSAEMRKPPAAENGGANIKSFPTLHTLDALIDCVTMCIHIASPQHTAVNYLQNYYQAFVVNKPPCLYRPPPTSLDQLLGYTEADLVKALPMNHSQEWLLSSHIPYLLSFKPGDKESLIMYAASKYHVYKFKPDSKDSPNNQATADAAARFYADLAGSEHEFKRYAIATDDSETVMYDVLSPAWNAVSILI